jgi:hypothetical protein
MPFSPRSHFDQMCHESKDRATLIHSLFKNTIEERMFFLEVTKNRLTQLNTINNNKLIKVYENITDVIIINIHHQGKSFTHCLKWNLIYWNVLMNWTTKHFYIFFSISESILRIESTVWLEKFRLWFYEHKNMNHNSIYSQLLSVLPALIRVETNHGQLRQHSN